ncbi:MAG: hypothetical protein JWP57_4544 [Spirosoma sp.]|nr:hypothetical protein [Spirosoma sp.]
MLTPVLGRAGMRPVALATALLLLTGGLHPAYAASEISEALDRMIRFGCSPPGRVHLYTLASTIRLAAGASFEARAEVMFKLSTACPELKQAYTASAWSPRLGPRRGQSSGVNRRPDPEDTPDD